MPIGLVFEDIMISFIEFLMEDMQTTPSSNGTYVAVRSEDDSIEHLKSIVRKITHIEPAKDSHATIIYSASKRIPDKTAKKINDEFESFPAKIDKVVRWTGHNQKEYIVALLTSDHLHARHHAYKKAGANHSFDEYRPHITLYDDAKDLNINMEKLNDAIKGRSINFTKETVEDIK